VNVARQLRLSIVIAWLSSDAERIRQPGALCLESCIFLLCVPFQLEQLGFRSTVWLGLLQ